jgi:phenylacetate-CoA ligase
MGTVTSTDLQVLRARFGAALATRLERDAGRPHWDAVQLASYQRERLRTFLARAIAQSPFHARRLAGINPGQFELADLARLPVMTKEQMMAGFDDLATDRRLTTCHQPPPTPIRRR